MLITKRVLGAYRFASDDETRSALRVVRIEPDGSGVATNGHILIKVSPNGVNPEEESFPQPYGEHTRLVEGVSIPANTCKDAEKAISKKTAKTFPNLNNVAMTEVPASEENHVSCKKTLEVTDLETWKRLEFTTDNGQFPNWERIIPCGSATAREDGERPFNTLKRRAKDKSDSEWTEYGVDARYLKTIAEFALQDASKGKPKPISLLISQDNKTAIGFTWNDSDGHEIDGLVMPMRV